jgi:hypothetical protein
MVARMIAVSEDTSLFRLATLAREVDGIADLLTKIAGGSDDDESGLYFLAEALRSISRRLDASELDLSASYRIEPTEGAR